MKKYTTKTISKKTSPGCWDTLLVEIYQGEEKIGEYGRNYDCLYNTFYPFTVNGQDYALYSKDYTATRIMKLPSCEDIGGEEGNGFGFCPVDYHIPRYEEFHIPGMSEDKMIEKGIPKENWSWVGKDRVELDYDEDDYYDQDDDGESGSSRWTAKGPFYDLSLGFVSGCVWSDDSSWKIQHLDLTECEKGIIKRSDRYGYIELPHKLRLKDAIRVISSEYVQISVIERFNRKTGKKI